ncbi:hypothetical protein J3458_000206 [Metarhizium acridum]|uniref:uncharacterized protein n=1 Tax=Metarhizium acridum TaxID=92637 RepID=UPI001C6B0F40|nr:hypothetical protein J3458_000206 [Metarhizium acridum]
MAPLTRKRKLLKHDEIEDTAVAGSDLEQDASTSLPSLLKCTGGKNPRTTLSQDGEALLPLQTRFF